MKMLKIIGLLCAAIFASNIQSMQSGLDKFAVERQFLQNQLSVNGYLSYLASLSPDYAYKIRAIRNSKTDDPLLSYERFLIRINEISTLARQSLADGDLVKYEMMIKKLRDA